MLFIMSISRIELLTTIPESAMKPIIEGKESGLRVIAKPTKIPIKEKGKIDKT